MAGTVTVTESPRSGGIQKIRWAWTSDASGNADQATAGSFCGQVLSMVTIPDDGLVPADNYDITITDSEGVDVMQGAGANRDAAVIETVAPAVASVAFGVLTLNVSNADNTRSGVTILYVRVGQ